MNQEKSLYTHILKVKVTTKSKLTKIKKVVFPYLEISLHAIPQKGEANEELIIFLSKIFSLPKSAIEISKGSTSPNKLIKIHSSHSIDDLKKILDSLM
jgi:uncharacterized protein (TIGR00251 family)